MSWRQWPAERPLGALQGGLQRGARQRISLVAVEEFSGGLRYYSAKFSTEVRVKTDWKYRWGFVFVRARRVMSHAAEHSGTTLRVRRRKAEG